MTKHFLRITGLALLCSVPFLGQALTASVAEDATCCGNAGCGPCGNCCPHCGCKLAPVCRVYCTTKKVTTYKYTCSCESICVPGVTRCGETGNGCQDCGQGCCKCRVHEVKHLVKIPCVTEVPVRKCVVEWVCPNCGHQGNCAAGPAPSAPAPSAPPAAGKSAANPLPNEPAGTATTSG
jgi:hypothetical protein